MLNRATPAVGAEHMQTYRLIRPQATHWRPDGTCGEARCGPHLHGWTTTVDETTELGAAQARYIRHDSGRVFLEDRTPAGLIVFRFEAGQPCFEDGRHRVLLEREPLYVVQGGDFRGNPRGIPRRIHTRAEDWVDDFGTNQQAIADAIARG